MTFVIFRATVFFTTSAPQAHHKRPSKSTASVEARDLSQKVHDLLTVEFAQSKSAIYYVLDEI